MGYGTHPFRQSAGGELGQRSGFGRPPTVGALGAEGLQADC